MTCWLSEKDNACAFFEVTRTQRSWNGRRSLTPMERRSSEFYSFFNMRRADSSILTNSLLTLRNLG